MYDRFTTRAKKVMNLANREARRFNHEYIGTEHVLLGLVKEGSGVASKVFKKLNVDPQRILLEVEAVLINGPDSVIFGKMPMTPRAKNVIAHSIEESRNLNQDFVGTEHILLGLLQDQEGVAALVLRNLGLNLKDTRKEIIGIYATGLEGSDQRGVVSRIGFFGRLTAYFQNRLKGSK